MSDLGEAAGAVLAVGFAGWLMLQLSSSLSSSVVDFQTWGGIYFLASVTLGIVLVAGVVRSVLP